MWCRLDDDLLDHHKIFAAGELIGKNGGAVALGFYTAGLLWSCKHLTDGELPIAVVKSFRHADNPLSVADALVKSGLWEKNGTSSYWVHDYKDFNPSAAEVKRKRKADRLRKREEK